MKKSKQQICKEVEKVIEGFLISFIDEYCELHTNPTKEDCHKYVKCKAEKAKDSFTNILTFDGNNDVVKSFKIIEDNWLISIENFKDFEQFLNKKKKAIN